MLFLTGCGDTTQFSLLLYSYFYILYFMYCILCIVLQTSVIALLLALITLGVKSICGILGL